MKRDQTGHKRNRKKKKNGWFIFFTVLVVAVFFTTGVVFGSLYYVVSGLTTTDLPKDDVSLGISEAVEKDSDIVNIALFGVDARDNSDSGRSDAIIVLSVGSATGQIKMTSILRDSRVLVDGHGETKLNHAYAYGGPTLAVKTLNQNYRLDIKEYVTVNFNQLSKIINAVDGVTLTLNKSEVEMANALAVQHFPGTPTISSSGEVILTGEQAVSYSRIRKIDTDNARASRQQKVLSAILVKIKGMPKTDYPRFIRELLNSAETSLSYSEILALSPIALTNFTIEQYTIPDAQYETDLRGGIAGDGVWYYTYDLDKAAKRIHSIIYDNGDATEGSSDGVE